MGAEQYYLGIDGGGSTTRALITDSNSSPIGWGEAGTCNPITVGCAEAAKQIDFAVSIALRETNSSIILSAAHFGIAGVGTLEIAEELRKELNKFSWLPKDNVEVTHDLACALDGGLAGRPGIVLIAGTGSAAYGRNAKGEIARASGRQLGNDDPGSGYAIGLEALSIVENSECSSSLKDIDYAELESLRKNTDDRAAIAKLAKHVLEATGRGDEACIQILDRQASQVSRLILNVSKRLFSGETSFEVVFQGSLINRPGGYKDRLSAYVQRALPHAAICSARAEPIHGACLLARAIVDKGFDKSAALEKLIS